jgi:hypothetical protein
MTEAESLKSLAGRVLAKNTGVEQGGGTRTEQTVGGWNEEPCSTFHVLRGGTAEHATVVWDDSRERDRLDRTYDDCDAAAAITSSWHDAWDWCRRSRPDLVKTVDDALDAIDAAFQSHDTLRNIEACRTLQLAVQAAVDAYLDEEANR